MIGAGYEPRYFFFDNTEAIFCFFLNSIFLTYRLNYHMYMPQLTAAAKVYVQNIVTCYIIAFPSSRWARSCENVSCHMRTTVTTKVQISLGIHAV